MAVYNEWNDLMNECMSLEIGVGMQLTNEQYDGVRFAMAFSSLSNRFKRKNLTSLGLPIPCPLSRYALQKCKRGLEKEVGMCAVGGNSVMLDIERVIDRCKKQNPYGIGGKHHLQVCCDAMRQYRGSKVTNMAIRSMSESNHISYNHLQSLQIAGIQFLFLFLFCLFLMTMPVLFDCHCVPFK